ncbi:hypothetical protein HSB1_36400 [Halogranum salarium B-1]|uniref:Uncharacterized protein n=1 Tax=Halogranum salarium B-1 TaxID=1210908 RepID=J2ZYX2_9EURY|nr:hypothetical protein HSB1_36400 [Halogranum salarium B-1]
MIHIFQGAVRAPTTRRANPTQKKVGDDVLADRPRHVFLA